MKYETPEFTALTPAINAIHGTQTKTVFPPLESHDEPEGVSAYQDWE